MQIRSFIIGDLAMYLIEGNDPKFDNRLDITDATRILFPVIFREYFLSQHIPDDVDIVAEALDTIESHIDGVYSRDWYYSLCGEIRSWIAERIGRWERVALKYCSNVFTINCYGDFRIYLHELEHGSIRRYEFNPKKSDSVVQDGNTATPVVETVSVTDPFHVADTLTVEAEKSLNEAYEQSCDIEYTIDLPADSELPDEVVRMRQSDLKELFAMPERNHLIDDTYMTGSVSREIDRLRTYKDNYVQAEDKPRAKHSKDPKCKLVGTIDYVHEGAPRGPWADREKVDMHKAVNRSRLDNLGSTFIVRQTCSFPK